jgi:hypothetical protein
MIQIPTWLRTGFASVESMSTPAQYMHTQGQWVATVWVDHIHRDDRVMLDAPRFTVRLEFGDEMVMHQTTESDEAAEHLVLLATQLMHDLAKVR